MPIRIGTVLYDCGSLFDRFSNGEKRVEGIGADWVVVRRSSDGEPLFANCVVEELEKYAVKPSDW